VQEGIRPQAGFSNQETYAVNNLPATCSVLIEVCLAAGLESNTMCTSLFWLRPAGTFWCFLSSNHPFVWFGLKPTRNGFLWIWKIKRIQIDVTAERAIECVSKVLSRDRSTWFLNAEFSLFNVPQPTCRTYSIVYQNNTVTSSVWLQGLVLPKY